MKRIFLSAILFILVKTVSFGQSSENEPNNNFSTASPLLSNNLTTASLGSGDAVDYHGFNFTYNANLYLELEITNTGSNGTQSFNVSLFNSLRVNGVYVGNIENRNVVVDEGETMNFTITVCGLAKDSFYLRMQSAGNFDYSMKWFPGNSFAIDDLFFGYNNTPATASPFSFNVEKEAGIGYKFWGNTNFDTVDYFTSTLPAANYDSVSLKIRAQSNQCLGSHWIRYFCYKNGSSTPFASGYVGDNPGVSSLQWVTSNIPLSGMQQGDNLRIKFVTNGTFGYSFIYKYQDIYDDDEDNCCVHNAITLNEGDTKGGNVGEYNSSTEEFVDEYDTYKIAVPFHGAVKVFVTAKNDECNEEYYSLEADILDKFGNELDYQTFISLDGYPACNTTITDSIIIRGFTADTFHLRLHSEGSMHGKISYTLRYETIDSTGNFDQEPNNTFATAIPIAPNVVKRGHVRFNTTASYDNVDFYKGTMPADGNIRVFLKTTYRGDYPSNDISLITNSYFTHKPTPRPSNGTLMADSIYTDTLNICGIRQGDISFELKTSSNMPAFEYEISYEITELHTADNDAEPNNSFAQARRVGSNSLQKGLINYIAQASANTDTYDFYKMVFTTTDSLKMYLQATNVNCYFNALSNRNITVRGYNKSQSQIFVKTIGNNTNVAPGQTVTDSIKIHVVATDTIYLRFEANTSFKYQFTTNNRIPYSGFQIEGDTAVCTGAQTYKAVNLADEPVTFHWSLPDGGGVLSFADSIATVDWNATGTRRIQLYLSNPAGNSVIKQRTVIINGLAPTQVPVAYNFARTLSTNSFPPGTTAKWYKDNIEIPGATDPSYYAANAGSYTVRFASDCGTGPSSNAIVFNNPALPQTISFSHNEALAMSPTAFVKLQATASSGLPVYYQKISGLGTIVNDTLFVTGAGSIIVRALQPGDDTYLPAPAVNDTIAVMKGNQVITFDTIPAQLLTSTSFILPGNTSSGLTIIYTIVAGNTLATVNDLIGSASSLTKKGAGTVTVRATQNGNANYNAATPVERTFCIGIRTLTPVTGEPSPCLATYTYRTQKIPGAIYEWTLSGGGILTTHNDTAFIQWQTPGTYTLRVKANTSCDTVPTNEQELVITTSNNSPGIVSNMQPANNAIDQQLPLKLSWIPGSNTVNYDLYLWDSTATEPVTPYAVNINDIQYVVPKNSGLAYNRTYKWKVVSKNPCWQSTGPVQQFRLIPLPDLVVSDVQAPATAVSGQTISISWKITNAGPGRTMPDATWYDGVYLALDTVPNVSFQGSPNWNPSSWNSLTANGRPVLLGEKIRPASLDSGQFYTNSLNFTLPLQYSFPVYVYVITDNEHPNWKVLQVSVANDTAKKQQPIMISLAPTPDLRVDSVFAPSSAFSGSTVNLTYKVKNHGVATQVSSSWVDSIFISQSPLFDRSASIPLDLPKNDGSYYPNVKEAAVFNDSLQVLPDNSYTRSLPVVIPNNIFGTYFIYVKANAKATAPFVYEGSLSNNNLNRAQLQVYLTPTPKLTVGTITLPLDSASTTQPIGANWNIRNEGFRDNVEKNRGHFITMGMCQVHCNGGPSNSICMAPAIKKDSVVFGSSYWLDRVYLSTDSTGLNPANAILVKELTHGVKNSGLYPDLIYCVANVNGNVNVHTIINPGADFPTTLNFPIPSDLKPGKYYMYVHTNPTRTVFEYPGTPQIKRSATPVTIVRPDATVPTVIVPSNVIGGQEFTISYDVLNTGPGGVFNHIRRDRVYVSNFSSFDPSAQVIDTITYTENLPVGEVVTHSLSYSLPGSATGAKYFYVVTNYDSAFRETNSLNNVSSAAMTVVAAALPADLVTSGIQLSDSVFTIFGGSIMYTVTNNGTGTTAGNWTDSVYFSCSSTFNFATNNFVAAKTQSRSIAPGTSYTDTINFTIPKMSYEINSCFPQTEAAPAYFFVKTNAALTAYEGSNINNNVRGSGSRIIVNPLVDHIVTTVSGAETATVGAAYPVSWRVKNVGYNPNKIQYYNSWFDGVFFSVDSLANAADALATEYLKYLYLNRGQDSADTRLPVTPNILTGDYYVYVKTNSRESISSEKVLTNNINFIRDASGAAKKIHVIRPLLADLVDSIISAPSIVAAGQPITIVYRVTNKGAGITYPASSFQNRLLLSADFTAINNDGDRLLATRTKIGILSPGQSYNDTVTVTIPVSTVSGNYVLISQANFNGAIMETASTNNLGLSLLSVFTPPVTDLIVDNVLRPDTVYLGYTMDSVKWVVKNASGEEARGYSTDGVYLSAGDLFDSTAILIGIKEKNISIQPLQWDTVRMAPLVTGVTEGNYNVFVRTDLRNNILESDKDNNAGITATPVYVKVKELVMNVSESNTLHTAGRYYKLVVPDSLYGATIMVTLKSNDSLTMRNEMFIGSGFVPTAAHYDYRYEIPNYGNQQIVMASVTNSTYYIYIRTASLNPSVQNITLKAVKLPFAILNVQTNSGGNIGNVTVRIRGSLFRDSMTATLSKSGTTIYASAVYFTNSTQVYATFNLQGRSLGVYDVTLIKPDESTVVLVNGFTVVPPNNGGLITGGGVNTGSGNGNDPGCDPGAASGLNSQLVVDMVVPSRVLTKRPVVILINYHNPTNFDIPAQSRVLYSEAGMKMAFTKAAVPAGSTSLYLELIEEGGPPGIIRAGGSGTIAVYTVAPDEVPPNGFVLFKIK